MGQGGCKPAGEPQLGCPPEFLSQLILKVNLLEIIGTGLHRSYVLRATQPTVSEYGMTDRVRRYTANTDKSLGISNTASLHTCAKNCIQRLRHLFSVHLACTVCIRVKNRRPTVLDLRPLQP